MIRWYPASVWEVLTLRWIKYPHAPATSAYIIPTPVGDPE